MDKGASVVTWLAGAGGASGTGGARARVLAVVLGSLMGSLLLLLLESDKAGSAGGGVVGDISNLDLQRQGPQERLAV